MFCVPRPDRLGDGASIGDGFRVIDIFGESNGCMFELAKTEVPSGSARASGLCDKGANAGGYALTLTGSVVLIRKCPTSTEMITFQLAGTVAVQQKE